MILFFWFFWYCYDDWLSRALSTPAIGNVHPFIWFIILILLCIASDDD